MQIIKWIPYDKKLTFDIISVLVSNIKPVPYYFEIFFNYFNI